MSRVVTMEQLTMNRPRGKVCIQAMEERIAELQRAETFGCALPAEGPTSYHGFALSSTHFAILVLLSQKAFGCVSEIIPDKLASYARTVGEVCSNRVDSRQTYA